MTATALSLTIMTGCGETEETADETSSEAVNVALAFSVSPTAVSPTRTSADVVQTNGNFRGLQDLRVIPFSKQGKIEIGDQPKLFGLDNITEQNFTKDGAMFYYFDGCMLMQDVASFLFYARAALPASATGGTAADKMYYGSLIATYPATGDPAGITFSPDPVWNSTEAPTEGKAIADYLTSIATVSCQHNNQTYSWRSAADSKLKAYYLNFINQGHEVTEPIASSTANAKRYVSVLREQLQGLSFASNTPESKLQAAIIEAIDAGYNNIPANYPLSIGLPDGAAVVRWNGAHFTPQTTTTTLANISSIRRYAYPAELYYYANSQIKTTTTDKRNDYYNTESTWAGILNHYEYDNGQVTKNTTSVAVKEPMQYAVACLQTRLNPIGSSSLTDAKGQAVSVGPTSFPLTGLIIGNQRTVGYDFTPTTTSDVDVRFVYDGYPVTSGGSPLYLPAAGGTATDHTSMLLLQTPDGEEVTIIAEFLNNSSTAFRGVNGLVYPGTRFYLIGTITPPGNATEDYQKRAFTQDYITTMGVSVVALSKAYNVLPDILTARLEIGIQLTLQWEMATPTNVELE